MIQFDWRLRIGLRLHPLEGVLALPPGSEYDWLPAQEVAQFRVMPRFAPSGWFVFEMSIDACCGGFVSAQLVSSPDRIQQPGTHSKMLLRPGRVTQRLVHVDRRSFPLRLKLMQLQGAFAIRHIRVGWVPVRVARRLMIARLSRVHERWRAYPESDIWAAICEEASESGMDPLMLALESFEATFQHGNGRQGYASWLRRAPADNAAVSLHSLEKLSWRPSISLLLAPVADDPCGLADSIASISKQIYPHWQVCLAAGNDTTRALDDALAASGISMLGETIKLIECADQAKGALDQLLAAADGTWVMALRPGDQLAPHALIYLVEALNRLVDVAIVYADSDALGENGERLDPCFKPDWNPDLLLAQNYIGRAVFYRSDSLRAAGGFGRYGLTCDGYEALLRCTDALESRQISHIPHILYHQRRETAPTTTAVAHEVEEPKSLLERQVRKRNRGASVFKTEFDGVHRIEWPLPDPRPMVTVLVPTRDRLDVLRPCVEAVLRDTDYRDLELIVIDNHSTCRETRAFLDRLPGQDARAKVLRWNHPFNFAALNNFAAEQAEGELLAFLNNDVAPLAKGWLRELVSHACREGVGCVGAKLYYPDMRIQHAGVILGLNGVADHGHKFFPRGASGYCNRLVSVQNLSAVTAACMVVRRKVFEQVGGFDAAHLPIAYNDVDLCLRIMEAGYRNIWTPYAELVHFESVSRGRRLSRKQRLHRTCEFRYMRERWGPKLDRDPAYNPNLSLTYEDFSLRF